MISTERGSFRKIRIISTDRGSFHYLLILLRYSNGVLFLWMTAYDIESGRKKTINLRRVSSISGFYNFSVSMAVPGVGRCIIRIASWFGINFFIGPIDAGATSSGFVGVPFDAEAMRGISEVPSLAVELLCISHLVLDPRLVIRVFIMLEKRGFGKGRVFAAVPLGIIIGLIVFEDMGLMDGLTWHVLVTAEISDNSD